MARANRHYTPGQIWHITQRCHKKEFLLKLYKDKKNWIHWLYEAKKRYELLILNYVVTSNHIHLLILDNNSEGVIPKAIQLIAGRTAQEYNQRKKRKGGYWEDRYHATAIESGQHLLKCLVYIDLNMVRTGTINHPSEWEFGGYLEIQNPRKKNRLIAYNDLAKVTGFDDYGSFKQCHKEWVEETLSNGLNKRQSEWSESIAVGCENYIKLLKEKMLGRAKGRSILHGHEGFLLKEPIVPYNDAIFDPQNEDIRLQNTYFWNENDILSTC